MLQYVSQAYCKFFGNFRVRSRDFLSAWQWLLKGPSYVLKYEQDISKFFRYFKTSSMLIQNFCITPEFSSIFIEVFWKFFSNAFCLILFQKFSPSPESFPNFLKFPNNPRNFPNITSEFSIAHSRFWSTDLEVSTSDSWLSPLFEGISSTRTTGQKKK